MRRTGKRILIIVEVFLEYQYSEAVKKSLPKDKQRSISIIMPKPNSENNAMQLLEKALKMIRKAKREKNPYDATWIFCDNDNQPQLPTFFQKINDTNVQIAYSSLCIEHWFIIHFEDNRRAYQDSKTALKRLETLWKKYFNQAYHKRKVNHFEKLKGRILPAMERANAIKQQTDADQIHIHDRNPYFTIQDFIHFFRSI